MDRLCVADCSLEFKNYVLKKVDESKKEILDFFAIKDNGTFNFNIYIYKSQSQLKDNLKMRGFNIVSTNICAAFKKRDKSLNFFEPEKHPKKISSWSLNEYIDENVIFHHTTKAIEQYIYKSLPEWLIEGIALYLDKRYLNEEIVNNFSSIDDLKTLKKEKDYYTSYLIVRYLIEKEGKNKFLKKINNFDYIKNIESDEIIEESISYYKNIKIRRIYDGINNKW